MILAYFVNKDKTLVKRSMSQSWVEYSSNMAWSVTLFYIQHNGCYPTRKKGCAHYSFEIRGKKVQSEFYFRWSYFPLTENLKELLQMVFDFFVGTSFPEYNCLGTMVAQLVECCTCVWKKECGFESWIGRSMCDYFYSSCFVCGLTLGWDITLRPWVNCQRVLT